jgi:SAM-dependent methyltransferase
MAGDVAPDGSPVAVYLALEPGDDLARVRSVLPLRARVLDLGSGPGRIANALAVDGHDVVAVDDAPEMLEHVRGARTVPADVWTLDLGERFDAVLALSHLINDPSRDRRVQLLDVCARHVSRNGVVVVQRLALEPPTEGTRTFGALTVRAHDIVSAGNHVRAATTYELEGASWTQHWEAELVDDAELAHCAADAGLTIDRAIAEDTRWVVLTPARDVSDSH